MTSLFQREMHMDTESNYRQALEGIQRLHRQDLEASKKRDGVSGCSDSR